MNTEAVNALAAIAPPMNDGEARQWALYHGRLPTGWELRKGIPDFAKVNTMDWHWLPANIDRPNGEIWHMRRRGT